MRVMVQQDGYPSTGGWAVGQRVMLDENEVHHLKVRRAHDGEIVEILDGAGLRGSGPLVQSGKAWSVEIRDAVREPRPAELTLAVAAGDRDRFSWMVEKAAELGVTRILPLETSRSSGVATKLRGAHLQRLRRQALEATKQCGTTWAPLVEDPSSLDTFLGSPPSGSGWLADAAGSHPPATLGQSALTIVIGPEGGLTDSERSGLISAGFRPTRLGPYTLRFETAAIVAAAVAAAARLRGCDG